MGNSSNSSSPPKRQPPRGKPAAKVGGAFAALAALSDSGKLSDINHADEPTGTSDSPRLVTPEALGGDPETSQSSPAVSEASGSPSQASAALADETTDTPVVPGPSPSADSAIGQAEECEEGSTGGIGPAVSKSAEDALGNDRGLPQDGSSPSAAQSDPPAGSSSSVVYGSAVVEHRVSPTDTRSQTPPQATVYGAGREVAPRTAAAPAFPTGPALPQLRRPKALPPMLAQKVQDLPQAYMFLAGSYREAKSARPGRPSRPKRNVRLHTEVAAAVTRQMVADKRRLGLRDIKPSHYVDAALSFGRGASVEALIEQAAQFRDHHLGEEDAFEAPNHYTISPANDQWLDNMLDELALARANGLHGYMINVVIEAYVRELDPSNSGES